MKFEKWSAERFDSVKKPFLVWAVMDGTDIPFPTSVMYGPYDSWSHYKFGDFVPLPTVEPAPARPPRKVMTFRRVSDTEFENMIGQRRWGIHKSSSSNPTIISASCWTNDPTWYWGHVCMENELRWNAMNMDFELDETPPNPTAQERVAQRRDALIENLKDADGGWKGRCNILRAYLEAERELEAGKK